MTRLARRRLVHRLGRRIRRPIVRRLAPHLLAADGSAVFRALARGVVPVALVPGLALGGVLGAWGVRGESAWALLWVVGILVASVVPVGAMMRWGDDLTQEAGSLLRVGGRRRVLAAVVLALGFAGGLGGVALGMGAAVATGPGRWGGGSCSSPASAGCCYSGSER